jgi:hypothetical protein
MFLVQKDSFLKTICTNIQKFGEVVVESKPCELTFVRKKDKQAQMMVADLSAPMSVDNCLSCMIGLFDLDYRF